MNSLSNCNNGLLPTPECTCPPRFAACPTQAANLHPLPCPAILTCGMGEDVSLTENITTQEDIVQLASVIIDTTCQCFPVVKIEFSSIIRATVEPQGGGNTPITARVRLRRVCGTQKQKLELFNLIFNRQAANASEQTIPFSFIYCDETNPNGECSYEVELIQTTGIGTDDELAFESVNIAAFSVGCSRVCK